MNEPKLPRRIRRAVKKVGGNPDEQYCTTCNTWYHRLDKGENRKHMHIERKSK